MNLGSKWDYFSLFKQDVLSKYIKQNSQMIGFFFYVRQTIYTRKKSKHPVDRLVKKMHLILESGASITNI